MSTGDKLRELANRLGDQRTNAPGSISSTGDKLRAIAASYPTPKRTEEGLTPAVSLHTATNGGGMTVPFPTGVGTALGRQGLTGGLPMLGATSADNSLEGARKTVASEKKRFLDAASAVPNNAQMDFTSDWTPQSYRQAQDDLSFQRKVLNAAKQRRDDIFLPMTDKSAGERIGLGARAIGETFASAPGVIGETTVQSVKNFAQQLGDSERQAAWKRAQQVGRLLNYYQEAGRTHEQGYRDLLEEQEELQKKLEESRVNTAVSMDSPGMQAYGRAAQVRDGALAGMEGIPRWLGEQAISIGQNAALLPTAAISPSAPLAAMSAISAADKMYELGSRGVGAGEALTRGLVSGGIEAATEKIPLENVLDILKTGGKGALKNIVRQAFTEAGEESVSYIANYLADKAYRDPKASFSLDELRNAALAGGFSGGVMAGGSTLLNRVSTLPVRDQSKVAMIPGSGVQAAQGQQKTASTGEAVKADTSLFNRDILKNLNQARIDDSLTNPTIPQAAQGVNPEYAPGNENNTQYPSPDSSVGAATAGFTGAYGQLQGQSAQFHPQGENARTDRLVDVPTQDFEGRNIPKSTATVLEAEATPDSVVGIIQDAIAKGEFSFDTITDKAASERARQTIEHKGWEAAKEQFHQDAKRGVVSKDSIALGQILLNNAMNAGDSKTVIDILSDYSSMSITAAQSLQAQRILKKMSPEGQLYGIQRSIQSIQEELIDKYKDTAPEIILDEGLTQNFLDAKTDAERKSAEKAIYKNIASQIPATFADKWNAWRYLSMLGNPRTHVRNIVGNLGFAPVRMAKNAIATGLEAGVDYLSPNGIQRTKAVLNPASSADWSLVKQALKDTANVEDQLLGSGKFNETPMGMVEQERTIFKTLPLEIMRKANSAAMDIEDTWFSKPAYAGALAGYLKANGVTAEMLQSGTVDTKTLESARAYAIREAQKATYRDTNALSEFVSNLRYHGENPVGKAANFLMEGVLPFRKTPANILMRGVEYSPIGLVKGLTYDLAQVRDGNMTAAQAIDNISAGLTGTGLVALGAFLAAQGLVSGGSGEDEKQAGQNDLTGGQPYAISIGGKNYTLDWLAPEALPFFVGVELWKAKSSQGTGRFSDDVVSALTSISEPMLEMSMLQSLQDLLDSVEYSDNKIFTILSTATLNHLTQAVPTLLGQAERTAESRRDTTFIDRASPISNDMQYTIGRVANKLPGVEFQQIPYLDAWGREENTGTFPERVFNNFLNPAYVSEEKETDVDRELQRLYDAGYDNVLPQRTSQSVKVKNEYLSSEDYVDYAKTKGKTSFQLVSSLIDDDSYQKANDEQKAKMINLAYEYATALAKAEVSDYQPSGWVEKAIAAGEKGIDPALYIVYENEDKDIDGSGGVSIAEHTREINKMFSSQKERDTMLLLQYPTWPEAAEKAGVSIPEYIKYKTVTASAGANKKAEKIQALVDSGMSEKDAKRLYSKIK